MKIADVVSQLRKLVPQLTSLFSTEIGVVNIIGDGNFINVQTSSPHNLLNGEFVNLSGVKVKTPITAFDQNGNNVRFQTSNNTDLTFGWPPHEFVSLDGFTDNDLNDSFKLVSSVNRKTFEVDTGGIDPVSLNGNEVLLEEVLGKFNGPSLITVVDTNNFKFESSVVGLGIGGLVHTDIRITGMATIARADEQYTQQDVDVWWMVVVPTASADVDKSRRTETDLNNESGPETDFQNYIMDGFNVYVYVNASESPGGLDVMDTARSEVLKAVISSMRGFRLPTVLSSESNQVVNLQTHGTARYDRSVYVHQFIFQVPEIMTAEDAVLPETVAFRDIPFTSQVGVEELTIAVDLDIKPVSTVDITIDINGDLKATVHGIDLTEADTIIYDWRIGDGIGNSIAQLNMPHATYNADSSDFSSYNQNIVSDNTDKIVDGVFPGEGALKFMTNKYVEIAGTLVGAKAEEKLTIATWVKITNNQRGVLFGNNVDTPNNIINFEYHTTGKTSRAFISGDSGIISLFSSTVLNIGEWYHLVITRDGSLSENIVKIFVNGNREVIANFPHASEDLESSPSLGWRIGADFRGVINTPIYLDGEIANTLFFDRVISEEQVDIFYNSGIPKYNIIFKEEFSSGEIWKLYCTPVRNGIAGLPVISNDLIIP